MKVSIALVAVLFVSAINSAPIQEQSNPIVQVAVSLIKVAVKQVENNIPNWDSSAAIDKNFVTQALEIFKNIPDGIETKLVYRIESAIKTWRVEGFDEHSTLKENVYQIVNFLYNKLPIPGFMPKDQIQSQLINSVINYIQHVEDIVKIPGFSVDKSFHDNLMIVFKEDFAFINDEDRLAGYFDELEELGFEDFPGFSLKKTLADNVGDILANVWSNNQ